MHGGEEKNEGRDSGESEEGEKKFCWGGGGYVVDKQMEEVRPFVFIYT